jgi:hypothetical protein
VPDDGTPHGSDETLEQVADELYALPPQDFVAARNDRAKAVQAAGDRDLAKVIRTLSRPSASAALANLLVRRDPAAFQPLLDLGVSLRKATASLDGAELRTLSRQQGQIVSALVRDARKVAKESGLKVSEQTLRELDGTLRAAIADAAAAEQLISARLAEALQHTGFGPTPTGHLTIVRDRPEPAKPSKTTTGRTSGNADSNEAADDQAADDQAADRRAAARAAAEESVAAAETEMEEALANRKQAAVHVAETEAAGKQLRTRIEQIRADLAAAEAERARGERDQQKARDAHDRAAKAVRAAARRLELESARLEDLD